MHCSIEEEHQEITDELMELLGKLDIVYAGLDLLEACERGPDLLLLDYGGMYTAGAPDTAAYNIRYARKWAEEHPGKLLVLWSKFTGVAYRNEAEQEFGLLNNVCYPTAWDKQAMFDKIQGWFANG